MEEISILDVFTKEELKNNFKEQNDGNLKGLCPCDACKDSTSDKFVLFLETNTSYNSKTHCKFKLLETFALKLGIIDCSQGNNSGENEPILTGELFKETLDRIAEEYGEDFLSQLKTKLNITDFNDLEKIEDADVREALSHKKIPYQRIGQGLYKNIFYYGTTLQSHGKPVSALVTSEKKIYLGINEYYWKCENCGYETITKSPSYEKPSPPKVCSCDKISHRNFIITKTRNPIKNDFGVNYRVEFNEDAIDNTWSNISITNYILNKYKRKTLKEIFETIVQINKKYIQHLNDTSHKYIACWIIGTYCYTLFEQYGRSYNKAEKGSGKTKQARVIRFLCFNPMWITKGTESSIFRDAEATCGTYIVDNMDKLPKDLLSSIYHIIETCWMNDATFRLTNPDTKRTEKYTAYTPMHLNNIFGLDENTIDKTFEILMLKSQNKNINTLKATKTSEEWDSIRNDIRCWVLDNYRKIIKTYNKTVADFSGREFDVVEGVLTIAELVDIQTLRELKQFVQEKIDEEYVDLEKNKSYQIFSYIWIRYFQTNECDEANIFFTEISEYLFPQVYPDLTDKSSKEYQTKKPSFSKYIAKIVRSVPMFRKAGISNGRAYVVVKRKDLNQYLKLQKYVDEHGTLLGEIDTIQDKSQPTNAVQEVGQVGESRVSRGTDKKCENMVGKGGEEDININKNINININKYKSALLTSLCPTCPTTPTVPYSENENFAISSPKTPYYDSPECLNIKPTCTKNDVFEWVRGQKNGVTFEEIYDKFGVGSCKFKNELLNFALLWDPKQNKYFASCPTLENQNNGDSNDK